MSESILSSKNSSNDSREGCDGDSCSIDHDRGDKSDFLKASGSLLSSINYKIAIFIFIIGMLIFSDLFIETILTGIPGCTDDMRTTTKGTIVQITLLTICYIILDLIVKNNII